MSTHLLIVISALVLLPYGWAEEVPKMERIERLVKDFAFSSNPKLKADTKFRIRKLEVKGLCEELHLQVFDIEYLSQGQQFNSAIGLYHEGRITSLAPCFGGHGMMSGTVSKGEFYYTYSWGSGIHRSHVAKLRVTEGKLLSWSSGGFQDMDLFVSGGDGDAVHVFTGVYKGFNQWGAGNDLGSIGTHASEIQVIGANGEILAPTFPYHSKKSESAIPVQPVAAPGTKSK